ncbi:DUF2934 domain-containing protein [Pseudomonas graminis]|uniref:DUF2934 domain-containing protein n=1 Tax=Pseudomonas graminis TaxID=158627 RepID=A0A1C2ED96_9PSED|nr:hypothetical protein BBI10_04175 [Pseudomonas graminis]
MNLDEKRISDFAYYIWQSEGEPEGEDARHWEMGRKLAETENSSAPAHVEERFPDAASKNVEGEADPQPSASVDRPDD